MAGSSEQEQLHAAFQRRAAAFRALGALHLVENLSPGAKPLALSRLEQKLGFPLPKALRTWWLLHDGEKKPAEGFGGAFHLLPVAWVLNERTATQRRLERLAGLVDGDARWVPIAARKGSSVVLSATSGQVFECADDTPPRVLAGSLVEWFVALADEPLDDEDDASAPGLEDE